MEGVIGYQLIFQMILVMMLLIPLLYWLKLKKLDLHIENLVKIGDNELEINVILPMRNEEKNVLKKLETIISEIKDYDFVKLTIADSNSTDKTQKIARDYLENSLIDSSRWEIINFDIPGKNVAINGVLDRINSDIFVISDADANVELGWLEIIMSRFLDSEIGVISGVEVVKGHKLKKFNKYYRSNSNLMRVKESMIDSTPVLEGSLLAWKSSALNNFRLNESMNADDAQIGFISMRNGFRSIVDERIRFGDFGESERTISESIRRSQGLSIALLKNFDLTYKLARRGARIAVFNAIILYVIFPWLVLFYCLNSTIAFTLNPEFRYSWESLSILSIIIILSTSNGRSLIYGCLISIIAHLFAIVGKRYNNWEPIR